MMYPNAPTTNRADTRRTATVGARRAFVVSVGLAVFFVFVQSLTAGEFITEGLSHDAAEVWTEVHGFVAYPIMVFALFATVIAATRLPRARPLVLGAGALFVTSVFQWLLGHAITTLGWNWVTPIHVVFAFVFSGLAIWLSMRSVGLRKVDAA